jgi:hypothetical protein
MTNSTQATTTKLKSLNVLKLYEHYQALEHSFPLLTSESQTLCKAELEQTVALRSEKIDRIYYSMSAHEDSLECVKKEQEMLMTAKKHHESQLDSLKGLLNWIRRSGAVKENKITGLNYEFTLVRKPALTVTIAGDMSSWSSEEQQKFCLVQEVTTTKQTVVRSMSGTVLEEKTEPKTKSETLSNLEELRNAYKSDQALPAGVKIVQEYSIRPKRLLTTKRVEVEASECNGEFLLQD